MWTFFFLSFILRLYFWQLYQSTFGPSPDPTENIQDCKGNLPYSPLHATNANHILSVGSIQIHSSNNIIELNDDISASVLYV